MTSLFTAIFLGGLGTHVLIADGLITFFFCAVVAACAGVLTVVFAVMLALIVAGRLLSGVHWFTDIIGGVLLSAALLNAYEGLLKLWKQRAKAQK